MQIEQFIKGLLEHMGSDAVPHAMKNADDSYSVAGDDHHLQVMRNKWRVRAFFGFRF